MRQNIRVLLVDDETAFTEVLSKRLERRGLAVACANGSEEAYVFLENDGIDVVVLDLMMPSVDGMQFFKLLKQRFTGVEVIFLSGKAGMEEAMQACALGAFDCLFKGTSIDVLEQRIREAAASACSIRER